MPDTNFQNCSDPCGDLRSELEQLGIIGPKQPSFVNAIISGTLTALITGLSGGSAIALTGVVGALAGFATDGNNQQWVGSLFSLDNSDSALPNVTDPTLFRELAESLRSIRDTHWNEPRLIEATGKFSRIVQLFANGRYARQGESFIGPASRNLYESDWREFFSADISGFPTDVQELIENARRQLPGLLLIDDLASKIPSFDNLRRNLDGLGLMDRLVSDPFLTQQLAISAKAASLVDLDSLDRLETLVSRFSEEDIADLDESITNNYALSTLYRGVLQDPELVTELSGSPLLTGLFTQLMTRETVQLALVQELFGDINAQSNPIVESLIYALLNDTTSEGEGVTLGSAVRQVVQNVLQGTDESAVLPRLNNIDNDISELKLTAQRMNSELRLARSEIQNIFAALTGIQRNLDRIFSALHRPAQHNELFQGKVEITEN
jgi:hypothetical protein